MASFPHLLGKSQRVAACAIKVDEPEDMIPIILLGLFLHFTIIVLGHHCIVKLKGRKGWFPGWLSWREGINGSIVLVVELLSTTIFVVFLAVAIDPYSSDAGKIFVSTVLAFFVIVAAYLYHYDFLVRQRRAIRKATRKHSTAASIPRPADPVEVELNQLRGQMGLTQMKPLKRPPKT